jgi:hypothetical protein
MPPVGFEPTISADELPRTCALDGRVTGTGWLSLGDEIKKGEACDNDSFKAVPYSEWSLHNYISIWLF